MKTARLAVFTLAALCALAFSSESFASGGVGGSGQQIKTQVKSQVKTKTQTKTKTQAKIKAQTKQQVKDGSSTDLTTTSTDTGKGEMRRLGPGDGTGNVVPPLDGTGYGSPATR